jgi:hypothetical protein
MYADVEDALLTASNGESQFVLYNRFSKLAELDLIDWLTGKLQGKTLPQPYNSIKNKDFLAPFLNKFTASAINGSINRPEDYYQYDSLKLLGDYSGQITGCDNVEKSICNTNVPLLDADVFTERCHTYIKGLKPSFKKPISQAVGNTFEFNPVDIGSVELGYFRYPKYGKIVSAIDPVFNEEIIDVTASTDYEWNDNARPYLLFFIVDRFANRTSNNSMKETNALSIDNPEK